MTIEIPDNLYSLREKIEYLRKQKNTIERPKPPKFPINRLVHNSTLESITTHAYNLLNYVEQKKKYDEEYEIAKKLFDSEKSTREAIDKQIEELINEDIGLTRLDLSEKKIARLWQKAWDDANNEDEAISNLRELVELFED